MFQSRHSCGASIRITWSSCSGQSPFGTKREAALVTTTPLPGERHRGRACPTGLYLVLRTRRHPRKPPHPSQLRSRRRQKGYRVIVPPKAHKRGRRRLQDQHQKPPREVDNLPRRLADRVTHGWRMTSKCEMRRLTSCGLPSLVSKGSAIFTTASCEISRFCASDSRSSLIRKPRRRNWWITFLSCCTLRTSSRKMMLASRIQAGCPPSRRQCLQLLGRLWRRRSPGDPLRPTRPKLVVQLRLTEGRAGPTRGSRVPIPAGEEWILL
mmetsp:Transcript_27228/g.65576  ORF Transcript_27228/g.65576 Transcript_27228/m.65576 type:complete len:267 (+) Transcript_27228:312-1112(+)